MTLPTEISAISTQELGAGGSLWRKWDLHVHTPKSIHQNYGGDTEEAWEKFISDLEALPKEYAVIGVNDYLFLDGYRKVLEYKDRGRISNIKLILPVIELRVDRFGNLGRGDAWSRVNLHVIFSNDVSPDVIESQFISALSSSYQLSTEHEGYWSGILNRESLQDFGQRIKDSSPVDINESNLKVGFHNLNFKFDEVLEKLKSSSYFKNSFFTAVGKGEWDNMRWDGSAGEKKHVINSVNFVFTASASPERYHTAREKLNEQGVNDLLIDCSDSHNFSSSQDKDRIGNSYTWIKADTTFEGLRQILYEPKERLKVQNDPPDQKNRNQIIDHVRFIPGPTISFNPNPIRLNPNLNVIIGGKSSGKSLLLYHIANTLEKEKEVSGADDDKGKTIKYDFILKQDSGFDFEVVSAAGVSQKLSSRGSESSILPDLKYIPQNRLSRLAEPEVYRESGTLLQLVRGLLLEDDQCKSSYDTFLSNVRANDILIPAKIDNYFNTLTDIESKESELKGYGNEQVLVKSITDAELEVSNLQIQIGLTPEKMEEYETLKTELKALDTLIFNLEDDHMKIIDFLEETSTNLVALTDQKNHLKEQLLENQSKELLDEQFKVIEDANVTLNEYIVRNTSVEPSPNQILDSVQEKIQETKRKKLEIEQQLIPFVEDDQLQKRLTELEESIKLDIQRQERILNQRSIIENLKSELQIIEGQIFDAYKANRGEYPTIVSVLESHAKAIEQEDENLSISGSIMFNHHQFTDKFLKLIDGRRLYDTELSIISEQENMLHMTEDELISQLREIFHDVLSGKCPLMKRYEPKEAIKRLLTDYFVDYWDVTFRGDRLGEMSTGKASFVILMLIIGLSSSKAPILIDQPEDNLDNRSITRDLVKYLREKKLERQIILVTHNPNIVVNADAESVIVANQKGQNDKETTSPFRFDYVTGPLENTFPVNSTEGDLLKSMGIRQHIADVVEGGEEAFKKRQEKYQFNG